ncbi:MAG: NnrU family protein [Pseudomonadota bacterium]
MTLLIVGLVLFLGMHSTRIVAESFRTAQVARLGLNGWKAIYSVVSIAGLVLLVYGYGLARESPTVLWVPPPWMRHVTALLTIPAFVLLAAAYVPGTRIKRAVGHPMVAGVKLWALAHLLANGTLADALLFGAFLVWAVFDYVAARRRDRAAGTVYATGPIARDATAVGIGLAAYVVFAFWLHAWWIGVRPFG